MIVIVVVVVVDRGRQNTSERDGANELNVKFNQDKVQYMVK